MTLPESLTPSKASTFVPPVYAPPPAYDAPEYSAMTPEQLASDPSYNWRFDQGQRALQTSQAAKGLTRTGGSMVDLVNYGQNAASQEYAAAEARRQAGWDRNFEGSQAEYAPTLLGWQTKTANDQRNAELQFDRDWQQELYNRDDAYRRMVFMADDNFRKVVYGTDDAFRKAVQAEQDVWKRQVMEEERRRWLAELGASA